MSTPSPPPQIAVLCRDDQDRPPGLESLAGRVTFRFTDADGLPDAIAGADGLFVWDFFSPAVRAAWPRANRLRWLHVAAAGVDAVLFDELINSDVVVTNARGVFDQPIAEYVLAMILAETKQLHRTRQLQREHRWQHRETRSLAGQHALIVGTGGIGRATARLLTAAGLRVTGAGRVAVDEDPDFATVVESSALERNVGEVDHLIMVAPLTQATTGLINARVLAAMKPGSHLINVGRGPSVDEDALAAALRTGPIGAASLDVFCSEPLPDDHPFWELPNAFVSPHMSGDTDGWLCRLAGQFVDTAERWLDGRELINIVDKRRGYSAGGSARREPRR
ncbi:D-2-hydroxyacid dehydrogenase [Microlunatus elymi]|uniref:D-2-hydroxyacid dehydrogenase n=1 Tax=Microlunatus elymi TaxID=2596828 RepID=A0A516Q1A0_9ACTN|nr:D-2-hydroxyacid dehydrogenase [Microlunatus elymi]QDP97196.1 D-2-hydroxyacid dehydrogenase [Microlunatus elymi]